MQFSIGLKETHLVLLIRQSKILMRLRSICLLKYSKSNLLQKNQRPKSKTRKPLPRIIRESLSLSYLKAQMHLLESAWLNEKSNQPLRERLIKSRSLKWSLTRFLDQFILHLSHNLSSIRHHSNLIAIHPWQTSTNLPWDPNTPSKPSTAFSKRMTLSKPLPESKHIPRTKHPTATMKPTLVEVQASMSKARALIE